MAFFMTTATPSQMTSRGFYTYHSSYLSPLKLLVTTQVTRHLTSHTHITTHTLVNTSIYYIYPVYSSIYWIVVYWIVVYWTSIYPVVYWTSI
jgi:hypothetical protein